MLSLPQQNCRVWLSWCIGQNPVNTVRPRSKPKRLVAFFCTTLTLACCNSKCKTCFTKFVRRGRLPSKRRLCVVVSSTYFVSMQLWPLPKAPLQYETKYVAFWRVVDRSTTVCPRLQQKANCIFVRFAVLR